MTARGLAVALAFAGALVPVAAIAAAPGDDSELDRIPAAAPPPPSDQPPAPNGALQTIYVEDAFTLTDDRGSLLVPPPPGPSDPWAERLFLDARKTWRLNPSLTVSVSARANLQVENSIPFPGSESFRLDAREAYLSWTPADETYIDVGRINLKSGVALGANPTDFFKTRAVVDPLSADPSVLREDRLGVAMIRAQHVWANAAVTLAYAPRLANQTPIYTSANLPSLNPMFDRTNAHDRLLVKANANFGPDFSPEVLVYSEAGRTQAGFNLTESLGNSAVAYVEWSGGMRRDLVEDALAFGKATGTLPANAPVPFRNDPGSRFRNDATVGFSYTTPSKIVFNLEYHYFEAGFSQTTWNAWFNAGGAGPPPVRAELWYIREYAADQQSPVSQQSVFLRADRQDAFVHNLELSGFVGVDARDGSGITQVEADYFLSDHYTVGGLVTAQFGRPHTDFGDSPLSDLFLIKLARYF